MYKLEYKEICLYTIIIEAMSRKSEDIECSNCGKMFVTRYNLNRHLKNCKEVIEPTQNQPSSNTDMFVQFMKKMEDLENENKKLKNELAVKNELMNEMKPIAMELPYDNDQLTKIVYKYNPYSRQYSIRRNGYVSKDFKAWYTLKYFNILDYPDTRIKFYKKCLEEILKNIPNDKLPYRVRDFKRKIYDIYNYNEKIWMKGNQHDLIEILIKKIMMLIHASLYSAINVLNEINTSDFNALENRKIDPTAFAKWKMELQRDLIHTFTLPDYDDEETDEDKYNFYKNNFVKIMNERLASDIKIEINEDEFKEYEQPIINSEIKNKKQKNKPTLTRITLNFNNHEDEVEHKLKTPTLKFDDEEEEYKPKKRTLKFEDEEDEEDDGYETDTKENPYLDVNYDSSN